MSVLCMPQCHSRGKDFFFFPYSSRNFCVPVCAYCPLFCCWSPLKRIYPFLLTTELIRFPPNLLFSRSLRLSSSETCSSPLVTFLDFNWRESRSFLCFTKCRAQNWTWHPRFSFTQTDKGKIISLDLLPTLFLMNCLNSFYSLRWIYLCDTAEISGDRKQWRLKVLFVNSFAN